MKLIETNLTNKMVMEKSAHHTAIIACFQSLKIRATTKECKDITSTNTNCTVMLPKIC